LRKPYYSDIYTKPSALAIIESENLFSLQNYLLVRMLSPAAHTVKFHSAPDCLPHSTTIIV
jgi:hypothetical protein